MATPPTGTQQPSPNRRPVVRLLLLLTIGSWMGITALFIGQPLVLIPARPPIFPYWPILRSTTTLDDFRPHTIVPTGAHQVFLQAIVPPIRTVVLGENGAIQEIWSNTAGNVYHYSLFVRLRNVDGPLIPYSPSVHMQYAALISVVDWRPAGRVYPSPETTSTHVAVGASSGHLSLSLLSGILSFRATTRPPTTHSRGT
ncbi:MAG: hypothetical protein V1778_04510 [bacterium]